MIYIEDGCYKYLTSNTAELNSSNSIIYDVRYRTIYPNQNKLYYQFIHKTTDFEIYKINKLLKGKEQ